MNQKHLLAEILCVLKNPDELFFHCSEQNRFPNQTARPRPNAFLPHVFLRTRRQTHNQRPRPASQLPNCQTQFEPADLVRVEVENNELEWRGGRAESGQALSCWRCGTDGAAQFLEELSRYGSADAVLVGQKDSEALQERGGGGCWRTVAIDGSGGLKLEAKDESHALGLAAGVQNCADVALHQLRIVFENTIMWEK